MTNVTIPKITILVPDSLLIRCNDCGEIVSPKNSIIAPIANHHNEEPKKTPAVIGTNDRICSGSYLMPSTAKQVMNVKINKGFESVKKKVEKYAWITSRVHVATGRDGFENIIFMPKAQKKILRTIRIKMVWAKRNL